MSRPPTLQWESTRGKWKVVYQGKKFRFDGGTGKADREAKKRAETEWKRLKLQADHEAELAKPFRVEYEAVIAEWTSVLTWAADHGDELNAGVARDKLKDLEGRLAQSKPPPLAWADRFFAGPPPLYELNKQLEEVYREHGLVPLVAMSGPVPFELTLWRDRLQAQEKRLQETGCDDTFSANVQRFLKEKRDEAAAGLISAARADTLRTHLDRVLEFTGQSASVRQIDQNTLSTFRSHLLQRLAAKELSDYYARDVFASFKLFVRWLASNTDKLEHLPKNIGDKRQSIAVAQRKAKTLDRKQVTTLFEKANDRTKLYVLLGLNCAMTQQDISDLRQTEVDWSEGTITRKRSKTSDCVNVPVVTYPLWPNTLRLLKQARSEDPEWVLLTRDGKTLKTESINEATDYKKTDAVRLAIRRLSEKVGFPFTMKMLKKTSASLMRNNRNYQGLASLFLDHAPSSVADKHYTTVPQELLNEAIAWLGKELGAT